MFINNAAAVRVTWQHGISTTVASIDWSKDEMIRHRGNIQPVTRDKRVPSGDGGGAGVERGQRGGRDNKKHRCP